MTLVSSHPCAALPFVNLEQPKALCNLEDGTTEAVVGRDVLAALQMRVRLNESGEAWSKAYDKKFKTNYWVIVKECLATWILNLPVLLSVNSDPSPPNPPFSLFSSESFCVSRFTDFLTLMRALCLSCLLCLDFSFHAFIQSDEFREKPLGTIVNVRKGCCAVEWDCGNCDFRCCLHSL